MDPTAQTGGYWQSEEQPPAPGWWKASDGQWYPPTQAPAPQNYPYASGPQPGGYPYGQPQSWAPLWPEPKPTGNGFSITAIVLGAMAFLFIPPLFGVAGLIFGGVGLSRKEKLAPVGMIVAGLGLVLGLILRAIVLAAFSR